VEEVRAKGAPSVVNLLLAELAEVGVVAVLSTPPGGLVFGGTS
jgi:hypothetical protein